MLETLTGGIKKLGLVLTEKQAQQFQLYYEELVDWNKRMNLTSITGYEQVQIKHFLDSLTLVPAIRDAVGIKADLHLTLLLLLQKYRRLEKNVGKYPEPYLPIISAKACLYLIIQLKLHQK